MKNKKKHLSKSAMSILLALVLLVSTAAVGIIATSAAYADGILPSDNAADVSNRIAAKSKDGSEELGAKDDSDSVGGSTSASYMFYRVGGTLDSSTSAYTTFTKVSGSSVTFTTASSDWYLIAASDSSTLYNTYVYDSTPYVKVGSTRQQSQITSGSCWIEPYKDGSKNAGVKLSAPAGTQVTVEFTNTSGNENTYIATFTSTSYTISYGSTTNGSFTTAPTSATSGSTVTVVATPSAGYELATFTVTNDSTSATISTSGSGTTRTFTMPSANVTVNATFTQASYTVSANCTGCAITGLGSSYHYGDTVAFTVAPNTDYALKSLTVKQGSTTITTTNTGGNAYTFTMPAGNVTITAVCANTAGTATIYFKSATAYVYVPYVSVNGGAEVKMTVDRYLTNSANSYNPKSETGSLRYAWYKAEISGLNTTSATTVKVRGQDTYMEATGSFNITDGGTIYLACDNLMEGSTLVDISSLATDSEALDFYDTPLNMIDN